ncbi:tripartite tricarboxylate transporter substrate binding protein [Variovorax sp. J22R133]|uniref:tripartite tricarboxylate transporter substrate binding protein n=1 Tax=Variovorax brevis TaxID=3053503 RepID=UPI002575F71A|nr:tripartite tricarboxylate transporter substrate binding protein [Variovorax sp. J22R133]MDM0116264.1 tripartite tricarboxylate transporter substrate binding protein [Variovorax sp. J22R133]
MTSRRNFALALAAAPFMTGAFAQNKRQMTVVVPWPAGASADILGRVFANALATQLGESVIVDNRPGAFGTIGAAYVASQPADGRTLLYTFSNILNQEFLLRDVKFRPLQSLLPFAKTCDVRVAIVAAVNHPANDLREFIVMAQKTPGTHSYAHYGGLGLVSMVNEAGIKLIRVPYKGGAPGLVDVAAGNVDIIDSSASSLMPLVQGGKLKILAVMTEKRWPEFPNVPTVVEILPRYRTLDYQCIFLPSETPKQIVDSLWKSVEPILSSPDYRRALNERGAIPDTRGPDEFKRYIVADHANIKKIVDTAGIRPE